MTRPAGVVFLDHTADVGIDVVASTLESLFHRAAHGMLALLRGHDDLDGGLDDRLVDGVANGDGGPRTAPLHVEAASPAELLANWLRELHFLHETEHRDYVEAEFETLDSTRLRARVSTEPARGAVREIKGVTYHELAVERSADGGWSARVIFDV